MGLLNDAIREHLELKRQHGADPSEVARLEQEALGPIHQGQSTQAGIDAEPSDYRSSESEPEGSSIDLGPARQETAELDMQAVLDGMDVDSPEQVSPESNRGEEHDIGSLEWETPASDSAQANETADSEDVLEETPDFLQETPEHERLWFEQRPPRDFDFDK